MCTLFSVQFWNSLICPLFVNCGRSLKEEHAEERSLRGAPGLPFGQKTSTYTSCGWQGYFRRFDALPNPMAEIRSPLKKPQHAHRGIFSPHYFLIRTYMSPGILQYARMVAFSNFRYPHTLTLSLIHTGQTAVKLDVWIWSRTPRRPEGIATLSKIRSRYAEYIDSQLKYHYL